MFALGGSVLLLIVCLLRYFVELVCCDCGLNGYCGLTYCLDVSCGLLIVLYGSLRSL